MPGKCVVLLSGGLDSILAIRIMQEQNVAVEALNFKTVFTCCQDMSAQAAHELGVPMTVIGQEDDYLELVKYPRFKRGRGANPCLDCRIYMFDKAKRFMEQVGAQFLASGEVVGQRPMSQKRRDLDVVSHHSDCEDILLRPLSAKLLPPTKPERDGLVDREKLYDFQGRGRKGLIQLAHRLGVKNIPTPSTGCSLTEPKFSQKVFDLIRLDPEAQRWDFETLKVGRHFRFDNQTKVLIGRSHVENTQLEYLHALPEASSTAILAAQSFMGPVGLLIGPVTDLSLSFAAGLIAKYAHEVNLENALVRVTDKSGERLIKAETSEHVQNARTLASV